MKLLKYCRISTLEETTSDGIKDLVLFIAFNKEKGPKLWSEFCCGINVEVVAYEVLLYQLPGSTLYPFKQVTLNV